MVLDLKAYLIGCIRCLLLLPADPQKLVDSNLFNSFILSKDQESLLLLYVPKSTYLLMQRASSCSTPASQPLSTARSSSSLSCCSFII